MLGLCGGRFRATRASVCLCSTQRAKTTRNILGLDGSVLEKGTNSFARSLSACIYATSCLHHFLSLSVRLLLACCGCIFFPPTCTVSRWHAFANYVPALTSAGAPELPAHRQVDREFVEDNFNLYGLRALVPHYNEALDMILDIERMEETPSDDRQVHPFEDLLCCGELEAGHATVGGDGDSAAGSGTTGTAAGGAHVGSSMRMMRWHRGGCREGIRCCNSLPLPPVFTCTCPQAKIESSAEYLYGLIHARYVLTSAGLNAVLEKFYNAEYGRCPRVFCKDQVPLLGGRVPASAQLLCLPPAVYETCRADPRAPPGQPVLPAAISDIPHEEAVKVGLLPLEGSAEGNALV